MQVFVGALIRGQTHVLISNMVGCRGQICTLISSGSQDSESAFLASRKELLGVEAPEASSPSSSASPPTRFSESPPLISLHVPTDFRNGTLAGEHRRDCIGGILALGEEHPALKQFIEDGAEGPDAGVYLSTGSPRACSGDICECRSDHSGSYVVHQWFAIAL